MPGIREFSGANKAMIEMLGRDEPLPHPLGPANPSARWGFSISLPDPSIYGRVLDIEAEVTFSNGKVRSGRGFLLVHPGEG